MLSGSSRDILTLNIINREIIKENSCSEEGEGIFKIQWRKYKIGINLKIVNWKKKSLLRDCICDVR